MITCSIINKSQLEGALRLDAEYYQPEYLKIKKKLINLPIKKLGEISEFVRSGPFGSNLLCETYIPNGVIVIRPFNLNNLTANSGELASISKEDCERQRLHLYKNGDMFFSRVGDVRFGIAEGFIDEITISPNIVAVRVKSGIIDPYFLVAFLSSRYGYLQVERGLKVVAQPTVETGDIKNIIIPVFNLTKQREVADLLKKSFEERWQSKSLYSQAENLLLEELGLKDFKVEGDLSHIVNFSEIKFNNRADAEYFQPRYEQLISKIKSQNAKILGDLVSMKKGVEPGSEAYQEEGKLFIRVSSLSKNGVTDKDQKYLSDDLYQKLRKDCEPRIGEILLTKDATPGITYVLKEPIEGIISGGILRLKLKEEGIDAEYLTLCINSVVGQLQVERDAGGSIIAHWKPEQIKNALIPISPKSTQQKIVDLVRKSHTARKKAKELLEEAKRKVENLIEN